jgi:hypothetical protein
MERMRVGARLAVIGLWCLVGALVGVAPAFGEGQPSSSIAPVEGAGMSSSLGGPLVTPESPSAGEELQAAREAGLASPEAVAAREASRTRYENEDQAQAIQTLGEAFPAVVDGQDGGPPPLAAGEKSLGFSSANVEQVETGSSEVGVLQSIAPIAVSSGGGHWAAMTSHLMKAAVVLKLSVRWSASTSRSALRKVRRSLVSGFRSLL